jgi:FKBP-type peptidyl-prolyl cis-trans isomerase SlyD
MVVAKDKVVSIHYVLKNGQGEIMDQSGEGEPLSYLHGADGIIPGLEKELEGKAIGEEFSVVIEPAEAYGEHIPQMVQDVPISQFPSEPALQPGMQFNAQTPDGPVTVTITAVNGDSVTVDGNHPLAGQTLHFSGNIDSIREATAEELDHGHVH